MNQPPLPARSVSAEMASKAGKGVGGSFPAGPFRGGRGGPAGLPPGAHLKKGPPPPSPSIGGGVGRGAAFSMGSGGGQLGGDVNVGSKVSSSSAQLMLGRGGFPVPSGAHGAGNVLAGRGGDAVPPAAAAAMRGKMPPPGIQMQTMPGKTGEMMGKMIMVPPSGMSRTTSPPLSVRPTSPASIGRSPSVGLVSTSSMSSPRISSPGAIAPGAKPPQQVRQPPLISGGPTSSPHPYPPQFAMVNGKKVMVPPGTKLPGPAPPGMQMAGKKMMMGGRLETPPHQRPSKSPHPMSPPLVPGVQQQQQQQQQRMPNGTLLVPPEQSPPLMSASPSSDSRPSPMRRESCPSPVQPFTGLSIQQLQQRRQSSPPVPFPPAQPASQTEQPPRHDKKGKSGHKRGLFYALGISKLGSDSDGGKEVYRWRSAAEQRRLQSSPGSGGGGAPLASDHQVAFPTPPRNGLMFPQGKRIMVPPGTKLPPGVKMLPQPQPLLSSSAAPAQQQGSSPAGPPHSGPLPPGAVPQKMSVDAYPSPLLSQPSQPPRAASVGSSVAEFRPLSLVSSPPGGLSPIAQGSRKIVTKAPPGVGMIKKMVTPPSMACAGAQSSYGQQSSDRPPLASAPSSRAGTVSSPQNTTEESQGQQQLQCLQALPSGAHLVKHTMGPLPPGAKLISSPPKGVPTPGAVPQHPPPRSAKLLSSPSPAPSGALRVPSPTVLKDGELPEAGVQIPSNPRRRLGESSEDSDEERGQNNATQPLMTNRASSQADSKDNSMLKGEVPLEDVVAEGFATYGESNRQSQQHEDPVGDHLRTAQEPGTTSGVRDDEATARSDAAQSSRSPFLKNRSKGADTAHSSKVSSTTAQKEKPPVRQTASSAAVAARMVAKKSDESEKKSEGEHTKRKTTAEETQHRRPAKQSTPRHTPKTVAEPASPQDEDNTQKPASMGRTSASLISTPLRSSSSITSPMELRHSQHDRDSAPSSPSRGEHSDDAQKKQHNASHSPHSPSPLRKKESQKRDCSAPQKRRDRRSNFKSEDDNEGSESGRLTTSELYRLVNALRDGKKSDKDKEKSTRRRRRGSGKRSDVNSANEGENSEVDNEEGNWGLRSSHSGSQYHPYHRRHLLSLTRGLQRDEETARRHRSNLPGSTVGIPWRYTSASRSSEPFSTPPPVRRPLGYINVGGGRYARVGSSPYAARKASATCRSKAASANSIPLDISNTAHAAGHNLHHARSQGRSLLSAGLDPETSALLDAHDNAVVNEVRASSLGRAGSPMPGVRRSSAAYYSEQSLQQQASCSQRPVHFNSPIRFSSPLLNETGSTVDSLHPYCVSAPAMMHSMQSLTPIRQSLTSPLPQQHQPSQGGNRLYGRQSLIPPTSTAAAAAAAAAAAPGSRELITGLSPDGMATDQPLRPPEQGSAGGNTDSASARAAVAPSPVPTADAARSPLAALRRNVFFEQLHSSTISNGTSNAPITSSAAIVGGHSATNPGWEWAPRRPTTPAGRSSVSSSSAPHAPSSQQQQQSRAKRTAGSEVGGPAVPSLIPTAGNAAPQLTHNPPIITSAAPPALSRSAVASTPQRASTPAARRPSLQQRRRQQSSHRARASSVGAAVSAAASGPSKYHNSNNNYNPDPDRLPSRPKEPARLTRATIARLSTPQKRHGGAAAAAATSLSPVLRVSPGGDANSSTAQTCSKWLDEILGSTTITATGVRVGREGQDAATAGTLPIVDLRTEFKPRVSGVEDNAVGRTKAHTSTAAAATTLQDPDANDYARHFTGSRPRPHIPSVSFKNMVGVRPQLVAAHETTTTNGAASAGPVNSNVTVRDVHGLSDGLPFDKYSSIRIRDPTRKSPWALAPEREGLDVLPGKPALSRRRRIPELNGSGGGAHEGEKNDGSDDHTNNNVGHDHPVKRVEGTNGRTVVEEVHLDEYRRPYLVVRPVPNAEAAEAQRLAVERLSRPKPIYQRAEKT